MLSNVSVWFLFLLQFALLASIKEEKKKVGR